MTNSTENVANEKVQDYVKKSHNVKENKPKSEKNTQDVQKNCSSLTEKWKNGELEKGYYYTQYNSKIGKPFIEIELRNYLLDLAKVRDADTVKILAPVPSYAEYMILVSYKEELTKACKMRDKIIKKYQDIDTWWQAENQKLKELLKECRDVAEFTKTIVNKHKWFDEVITRIDEVLK